MDLQGNVIDIDYQSLDDFTVVIKNGRRLLKRGNYLYSFLSEVDIERGLKPVRLFEEK